MPKLPVLSGADVVRALQQLGYIVDRQRGSHVVLKRRAATCVVPLHAELKRGTLAAILRQADVTVDQLLTVTRQ